MENQIDYEPYGPDWKKEMMKWRKDMLIDWIRKLLMEKHEGSNKDSINQEPESDRA